MVDADGYNRAYLNDVADNVMSILGKEDGIMNYEVNCFDPHIDSVSPDRLASALKSGRGSCQVAINFESDPEGASEENIRLQIGRIYKEILAVPGIIGGGKAGYSVSHFDPPGAPFNPLGKSVMMNFMVDGVCYDEEDYLYYKSKISKPVHDEDKYDPEPKLEFDKDEDDPDNSYLSNEDPNIREIAKYIDDCVKEIEDDLEDTRDIDWQNTFMHGDDYFPLTPDTEEDGTNIMIVPVGKESYEIMDLMNAITVSGYDKTGEFVTGDDKKWGWIARQVGYSASQDLIEKVMKMPGYTAKMEDGAVILTKKSN